MRILPGIPAFVLLIALIFPGQAAPKAKENPVSGKGQGHPKNHELSQPPNHLEASAVSPFEIDLSWQDLSTNEDGFKIERSIEGNEFVQIAQVLPNTTIYRRTGL